MHANYYISVWSLVLPMGWFTTKETFLKVVVCFYTRYWHNKNLISTYYFIYTNSLLFYTHVILTNQDTLNPKGLSALIVPNNPMSQNKTYKGKAKFWLSYMT